MLKKHLFLLSQQTVYNKNCFCGNHGYIVPVFFEYKV